MYLQAIRQKLRFPSAKGTLSVEQLFDLKLDEIDAIAKQIAQELSLEDSSNSFLSKSKPKTDSTNALRLEILVDVIKILEDEIAVELNKHLKKAQKEKILSLISAKQDEAESKLSIEELEAMLKNL